MWFRVACVVLEMFHLVRVTNVVVDMLHGSVWPAWMYVDVVSCGQCGPRDVHVVSCGQRGTRDASCGFAWPAWYTRCFMWFRVASVVLEMFHVVSCGQCGSRHASCGSVWPAWMWFCVASVEHEMLHVVSSGVRSFEMFHVASCCQRGLRHNSCCFVWPAWCSRCFICFRDVWPAWYPRYFMLFGFSFSVNHAEVCVIEGKLFLVTTSGGTAVRMMRKGAKRWLTFHLSKRNSTPSSFWAALINWLRGYLPAEHGHAAKVLG